MTANALHPEMNIAEIILDDDIATYAKNNLSNLKCPPEYKTLNPGPNLFCIGEGKYEEFVYPSNIGIGFVAIGPGTKCNPSSNNLEGGQVRIWITPSPIAYMINLLAVYIALLVLYTVFLSIRDRKIQ